MTLHVPIAHFTGREVAALQLQLLLRLGQAHRGRPFTMVPRAGGIAPRNIACTGWVNSFVPSTRKKMKLQGRREGGHGAAGWVERPALRP